MTLRPEPAYQRPQPIRVPAEGTGQVSLGNASKTGTALMPVIDEKGNVTGYAEVQSKKATAKTPLYLIGVGPHAGVVKSWNPVLARNTNFRGSNVLPVTHVQKAKGAARLEIKTSEAVRAYAVELKQQRIQEQQQEAVNLAARRRELLNSDEVVDLQQQLDDGYEVITAADHDGLAIFAAENELPIDVDAAGDLDEQAAAVRALFEQRIEALFLEQTGQATTLNPEQEKEPATVARQAPKRKS